MNGGHGTTPLDTEGGASGADAGGVVNSLLPSLRRSVFARIYSRFSVAREDDHEARVTELHWSDGRVVQISSWPDDDGALIRVWPANGTAEYGGGNLTTLSVGIRFNDDGSDEIEHLDVRKPLGYRGEVKSQVAKEARRGF